MQLSLLQNEQITTRLCLQSLSYSQLYNSVIVVAFSKVVLPIWQQTRCDNSLSRSFFFFVAIPYQGLHATAFPLHISRI